MSFTASDSMQRLLESIKKLENTLLAVGLPRFLARAPVWWLCWHYCGVLDEKIQRMVQVEGKFRKWLPVVRSMSDESITRMELIDVDHSMQDDIVITRNSLWELRSYCLEVSAMFERLGYVSSRLQQRQQRLLKLLEESCVSASILIDAVAEHDRRALALLQAQHLQERAVSGSV